MKKIMLFLVMAAFQLQAWAGNEIANGGDAVAAQFISTGQFLLQNWQQIKLPSQLKISQEDFEQALKKTVVETRKVVKLDGRIVDAINIPEKMRIVVNRTRWAQLSTFDRLTIVFHEYLGLLSEDDRNFEITPRALIAFNQEAELIARTAALLITDLQVPPGSQCPVLSGHWHNCYIGDMPGFPLTRIHIDQAAKQGTQYAITSQIDGLTEEALPGGRTNATNTTASCADDILFAQYHGPTGETLAQSETVRLGEEKIYMWLAISGVGAMTITCEQEAVLKSK